MAPKPPTVEEVEMSSAVVESDTPFAPVSLVFTGGRRWAAAAILVSGPLLQAIEFLLENPSPDNSVRVADWAANPTRIELGMASGLLAVAFLIGGFAVLVALTRRPSPILAFAAAVFLTFGMAGLAAVHGYELAAYGLVRSGSPAAATAVLNGDHLGLAGPVFFVMFLGGGMLGLLTLAAAVWRSPHLPRIVTLFILAFVVLDAPLGQGLAGHLVNLIGFSIAAAAVVMGYSRTPHPTSWRSRLAW
jgi:hypothetical protein